MVTREEFEVIYGQLNDLTNKFTELNRRMSPYYLQESLEEADLSKEERDVLAEKLGELRTDGALREAEEILTIYQASVLARALGYGISPVPTPLVDSQQLSPANGGEGFAGEGSLSDEEKGLAENLVGRRATVKVSKPSNKAEIVELEPGDGVVGDEVKVPWDGVEGFFSIGKTGWKKLQEAGVITTYEKFLDSLESWLEKGTGVITKDEYEALEGLYFNYIYALRWSFGPEEFTRRLQKLAESRGLEFIVIPQN